MEAGAKEIELWKEKGAKKRTSADYQYLGFLLGVIDRLTESPAPNPTPSLPVVKG